MRNDFGQYIGRIAVAAALSLYGLFALVAPYIHASHIALSIVGKYIPLPVVAGIFLAFAVFAWVQLQANKFWAQLVIALFMSAWLVDTFFTKEPGVPVVWFPYVLASWFCVGASQRAKPSSLKV